MQQVTLVDRAGSGVLGFFEFVGAIATFGGRAVVEAVRPPHEPDEILRHLFQFGYRSAPLIVTAGFAIGIVLSMHTRASLERFGAEAMIPAGLAIALIRETGPLTAGLLVSGRVGAGIGAEIGAMKVTEQIDALRALAVYPTDYLVVPRALAMMVSMPLLVAECIAVGIAAGYFIAIFLLEINGTYYMANMVRWTRNRDIIMGLSKAFCFGILIVFISCQKGLSAREGAVGVGRATTEAVVNSSLAVLICNFFLTMLLNIIYPAGYQ